MSRSVLFYNHVVVIAAISIHIQVSVERRVLITDRQRNLLFESKTTKY